MQVRRRHHQDGVQIGDSVECGRAGARRGYLLEDGTAFSRTIYAALFDAIGTTFGAGDGSTTFNIPDRRQRFGLGKAASGTGSTLGGTGGLIDHTHTGPSHDHSMQGHTHNGPSHDHSIGHEHTVPHGSETIQSGTGAVAGDDPNTTTTGGPSTSGPGGTGPTSGPSVANTGLGGTGATGTANPPFIAMNYMIKF